MTHGAHALGHSAPSLPLLELGRCPPSGLLLCPGFVAGTCCRMRYVGLEIVRGMWDGTS